LHNVEDSFIILNRLKHNSAFKIFGEECQKAIVPFDRYRGLCYHLLRSWYL